MPSHLQCAGCMRRIWINREIRAALDANPCLCVWCRGCIETLKLEDRQSKAEYERELRERYELPTDHPIGGGHV